MRTVSRIALALLALILTSVALVATSAPANATDYYRFWYYFNPQDGGYVASLKGPADVTPKDGAIDAYRFEAPKDFNKPNLPRVDLGEVTFDAVCADQPVVDGQKRVAVIIDFGVDADAKGQAIPPPKAACAQVPTKANGLQVLGAPAEIRTENHGGPLLCAIDGFPAKGCANDVSNVATPADDGFLDVALDDDSASADPTESSDEPDATEDDDDSSNALLYVGLGLVVVVLVAGGVYVTRRRSS